MIWVWIAQTVVTGRGCREGKVWFRMLQLVITYITSHFCHLKKKRKWQLHRPEIYTWERWTTHAQMQCRQGLEATGASIPCSAARKRQCQTREAGENTAASTATHTDTTQSTSIKLEEATKTNCHWGTAAAAAATSPPSCWREQPLAAPFMKHAEQDGDRKLYKRCYWDYSK